jgi:hypothetical protein
MSVLRFNNNLSFSREDREEIVIVTSKQYLAVADDFLRRLFPALTPDRLTYPGPFSVFIADDECVLH